MILRSLFAVALTAGLAAAQTPGQPAFEVASIKPAGPLDRSKILTGQVRLGMKVDGARVDIGYFSLADLIRTAYGIKAYQLQGPDWMKDQRWEIQAKLPEGASQDQVPQMLQAMLAERFKLVVRRSSAERSVYGLVAGKGGPKLKEAEADPGAPAADAPAGPGEMVLGQGENQMRVTRTPGGRGATVSSGRFGHMTISAGEEGMLHLQFSRMKMADFADLLSPLVERPVVDQTELTGLYQVGIELPMQDLMRIAALGMGTTVETAAQAGRGGRFAADAASNPGASVFAAVERLGLKLEARKAPLEMLIVERLEKIPTEN